MINGFFSDNNMLMKHPNWSNYAYPYISSIFKKI